MDRARFFSAVRLSLFGGKLTTSQVKGMEGILDAFAQVGDGRAKTLGYGMATAFHETGKGMVPMREGCWRNPPGTDAQARAAVGALARKLGAGSAPARYVKPLPPYGHVYYGRGLPQLTWGDNYKASSADAGVDLFAEPDAMLDPRISARVLIRGIQDGRWNGLRLGIAHYLPDAGPDDLQGARRTVNVTDKWELIAGYHRKFLAALEGAGFVAGPQPPRDPVTAGPLPADTAPPADLASLQALAQWRAEAPTAALAATTQWLQEMPT